MTAKKILLASSRISSSEEPVVQQIKEQLADLGCTLQLHLSGSTGELIEALREADVLINLGHAFPSEAFQHMGNNGRCQGAVFFGHGFDALDLDAANKNGVVLANTASFGTEEVSNHAMMLFLVCARKFVLHDKLVKSGVWTREHLPPMGHISGQTFGVIGLGDIGRATARKARAFGCQVIAYDPFIAEWDAKEYDVELVGSLEALAQRSDYVAIHTFLNKHTHHMIGKQFFASMKNTAYLINCSRGPVVDEASLIAALQNKEIAGAGLDVFEQEPVAPDNPLLKMDSVAVTNHYASYSESAWQRAYSQLVEESVRIAHGFWPMSLINPGVIQYAPERKRAMTWEVTATELRS